MNYIRQVKYIILICLSYIKVCEQQLKTFQLNVTLLDCDTTDASMHKQHFKQVEMFLFFSALYSISQWWNVYIYCYVFQYKIKVLQHYWSISVF